MATVAGSATGSANNSAGTNISKQPSRFLISDLCTLLESYLSTEHVKQIYSAYLFSANAHEGNI